MTDHAKRAVVETPPPHGCWHLTGVVEAALGYATHHWLSRAPTGTAVLVGESGRLLERWRSDLSHFSDREATVGKPLLITLPEADAMARDSLLDRARAFSELLHQTKHTPPLYLFSRPAALLAPVPSPEDWRKQTRLLKVNQDYPFAELRESLANDLGYDCEPVCENPGEFAVRGGIIDVYPVNALQPYRLDFFGDTLESIRPFDPATQRTDDTKLNTLILAAAPQKETTSGEAMALDYLPPQVTWIIHQPDDAEDHPESANWLDIIRQRRRGCDDEFRFISDLAVDPDAAMHTLPLHSEPLLNHRLNIDRQTVGHERLEREMEARGDLLQKLNRWQKQGYRVEIIADNPAEIERLREIIAEEKLPSSFNPVFHEGHLRAGFILESPDQPGPLAGLKPIVIATDRELLGREKTLPGGGERRLASRRPVEQLLNFSELADGDPLVHLQHGICLYRGITRLPSADREREVISLEFDDQVILHLPLAESHLLTRYVGFARMRPKLGRLGSGNWEKTRQAAEEATLDFAAELLKLQAERSIQPGRAFPPDQHWQKELEQAFPHRETPDQLQAIIDTKDDMEKTRPMDRLLCGDVGFGKTEVAIRAAFKAVMGGSQVAILAPTTVLVQQHYNTFRERMAEFPVVVEMLSRFRKPAQQRKILRELKEGKIDIVIGTHSLLGKAVKYHDLGLLVIDEEHRFGVKQKERLKQMRTSVDVLAMSATPIPRTLYMALVGARDLSVIETAPTERLPIQTEVQRYSPELVQKAIRREVDRGGQVFYLHNRVQTIETVTAALRAMLPDLRIGFGHGQMEEDELETIMTRFIAGDYDVLVCTTIIESGLDIPNCNTIIIEGADRFGLSQLYQLRGRVGRFNRQAYAYLLLHRHSSVLDQARKRLSAMRQYNQLGAGFRIAMRDLELRGAGNLLGVRQSGHIAGVGFDLYCQLLRQSIARLKGDPVAARVRASVRLDFISSNDPRNNTARDLPDRFQALKAVENENQSIALMEAHLPADYISETTLRIDVYRRLAMTETPAQVRELARELTDRFGKIPPPAAALFHVTEIRCLAESRGLVTVETEGNKLKCRRIDARPGREYLQEGNRFPRLTAGTPILRLKEIKSFLTRQPEIA